MPLLLLTYLIGAGVWATFSAIKLGIDWEKYNNDIFEVGLLVFGSISVWPFMVIFETTKVCSALMRRRVEERKQFELKHSNKLASHMDEIENDGDIK